MIALVVVIIIVCIFVSMYVLSWQVVDPYIEDLKAENKDRYDERLSKSMEIYAYQIIVRRYVQTGKYDAYDKLIEWSKSNIDPDGIIKYAIVKADISFQHVMEIAEQQSKEPNFGIDMSYDYRELPITMCDNKHVNIDTLLKLANELLEVKQ